MTTVPKKDSSLKPVRRASWNRRARIRLAKAPRAEGLAIARTRSTNGIEVAACTESMTKQRREGEANGPQGQRPARASEEPKLAGVRQTGASGRSSDCRHWDNKRCRAKGLWAPPCFEKSGHRAGSGKKCRGGVKRGWKGLRKGAVPECGSFQPDWGKLTVRDDKRGWRKRRQDLMAICHEARKG
jgi:hypothetical protein